MGSSPFHIILLFFLSFTCNKPGSGSETWEWLVCLFAFFFSPLAKGTLQLYLLLLKRGTPWLNGKPEGSDSSNNGNIQIYGSGGGRKNGGKKSREEVTRTTKWSVAVSLRRQRTPSGKMDSVVTLFCMSSTSGLA